MAAWSHKTLKNFENVLRFFEKGPLKIKISKLCFESLHLDTDRLVVFKFREVWPTGNRWNRALHTWQITTFRLAPQQWLLSGFRPKSLRASRPASDSVLRVPQISYKSAHFRPDWVVPAVSVVHELVQIRWNRKSLHILSSEELDFIVDAVCTG